MDAVLGREEGDDERDAQVGDRQVAEQQLGIVLAERLGSRVLIGRCELAKVRQVPHVQQVVLTLDARRARVLIRVGERGEPRGGHFFTALDPRLGREQLEVTAGQLEATHEKGLLGLVVEEEELRLTLRVRGLFRKRGDLRVEEEFEVEGDVAEAAELGVVFDHEVINVADILGHVVNVGREGEVLRDLAQPLDRLQLERARALPRVDLGQRALRVEVVEHARARRIELGRVYRYMARLLGERAAADREALMLVRAAQVQAHAGRLVSRDLAHDHVRDGRDARGHDHSDCIERARVVEGEHRGCKVLEDALEEQQDAQLLVVQQRRAPKALLWEDGPNLVALGLGHREHARERVLDEADLEEVRVEHRVRLHRRLRAQHVARAQRGDCLLERGRCLRLAQKVERLVLGQVEHLPRVDGGEAQKPIEERVQVRRLLGRGSAPWEGARVPAQQPHAIRRDQPSARLEEHEAWDRAHLVEL